MRTKNTHLTPEQRQQHAQDWRAWRKKSRAGARAAFVHLRAFKRSWETADTL